MQFCLTVRDHEVCRAALSPVRQETESDQLLNKNDPNKILNRVASPYSPKMRVGRRYRRPIKMLRRMPAHTSTRPTVESRRKLTMYLQQVVSTVEFQS